MMPVKYSFTICHCCHRFKIDGQQEWHEMIPEFSVSIKYLAKASLCGDCRKKIEDVIQNRKNDTIFKECDQI